MHKRVKNAHCSVKDLAEEIIQAADQNEIYCEDDTCILAYSLLRDCGYNLKRIMAEDNSRHCDC